MLCRTGPVASTHHINRINVGKLVEELTTAEGELGICLEELFSEKIERRQEGEQFKDFAGIQKVSSKTRKGEET